jgi:hypothetical protein
MQNYNTRKYVPKCTNHIDIKCSHDFDLFVVNVEAMQERKKEEFMSFRYSMKSELFAPFFFIRDNLLFRFIQ